MNVLLFTNRRFFVVDCWQGEQHCRSGSWHCCGKSTNPLLATLRLVSLEFRMLLWWWISSLKVSTVTLTTKCLLVWTCFFLFVTCFIFFSILFFPFLFFSFSFFLFCLVFWGGRRRRFVWLCFSLLLWICLPLYYPQWDTVDAEINVSSVENSELWIALPLKTGVGENIATHVSCTAWNFFVSLISTFPVRSPSFFKILFLHYNCISFGWRRFKCGPVD